MATPHRTFVRPLVAVLLLVVAWPAEGGSQIAPPHRPIRFDRSEVEPHLPQSSVYAMLQDRHGFLWFGTREGLGRWDGHEMRTWKARPFAEDALPDNVVRQLREDRQGSIWMVVVPDNFEASSVARLVGPDHARVQRFSIHDATLAVDADGVVWVVGPDSIYRFDEELGDLRSVRPRLRGGVEAGGATIDRDGVLWVGTAGGVLERYAPGAAPGTMLSYPVSDPESNRFQRILEDADGTIWISGRGLRKLDSSRTRVVEVPDAPEVFDTTGTADILQDPDGWLWLATLDGVYRFDPLLTRVERYSLRIPGNIETQNWVVGLLRDRAGSVWAGTVWGLHRYDPADEAFGFLGHDPDDPNTLGSGIVLPILEDETGAIWVGTLGGGLNRIDSRTGAVRRFRSDPANAATLPHDWIWSLADAGGGRVWVGTEIGLGLVDPSPGGQVRRIPLALPPGAQSRGVYTLQPDSTGALWVGTGGWLLRLMPNGETHQSALPFLGTMYAIRPDGPSLWIGTSGGLVRFIPESGEHTVFRHDPADTTSLGHDVVLSLHQDRSGELWVGTNSGLNRLDRTTGRFARAGGGESYPEDVIYSILEAGDGRLWMGTNRGLLRFDPAAVAGQRVRRYDASSGLGNVEFNRNAGLRGRDGTLYFGGDRGLTIFRPDELGDNLFVPPVVVTAVQLASREGTRLAHYVPPDEPVVVAPADYTLTFSFAALNFTNPGRNQHSYRMEGFDPEWTVAGPGRTASYTNLPPGHYTFRVRGSNDDGVWNETGVSIPVVVQPAFFETSWFRGALVLLVLGLVSVATAAAQRQRHRRELAELSYRQALEGERIRISRDMHDEVGAGLTEIALLSDRARHPGPAHGNGAAALDKIARRSREMLDALGEIIWAINPDNDRAERLAPYLREYAGEFLEGAGLDPSLHFEVSGWTGAVSADFRRNLFLILKESLTNAVRHADARRVEVRLEGGPSGVRLVVRDDGHGMPVDATADAEARGHHGLANLHRRVAALGGTLVVHSTPGVGTRLEFDIPGGGGRDRAAAVRRD